MLSYNANYKIKGVIYAPFKNHYARVIFNHEQAEAAPTLYQLFEVLKDCSESEAQSIMNMALIFLASSRGENGYTLSKKSCTLG